MKVRLGPANEVLQALQNVLPSTTTAKNTNKQKADIKMIDMNAFILCAGVVEYETVNVIKNNMLLIDYSSHVIHNEHYRIVYIYIYISHKGPFAQLCIRQDPLIRLPRANPETAGDVSQNWL